MKWGVIGVGRAGSARVRALREDPRAEVVLGLGGAPESVELPAAASLDHLLSEVDAVAVCTPDDTHAAYVEGALAAGLHVVCEFPLAPNALVARRLFRRAREAGRVLHVEHIELLSGSARYLRGHAALRTVEKGSLRFRGTPRRGGISIAHSNVARLHRLADVVGTPRRIHVEERTAEHLRGHFPWGGEQLDYEFVLSPEEQRRTELSLLFTDGSMAAQFGRHLLVGGVPVELPKPQRGLFAQDQLHATARILDGALPYVTEERVVEVLQLADRLMAVESEAERLRREAGI